MKSSVFSLLILISFVCQADSKAINPGGFVPTCELPFAKIKQHHPIDDSCGLSGETPDPGHQAQNLQKNKLCLTALPTLLSYDDFLSLQKVAGSTGFPTGTRARLSEDRSKLKSLKVGMSSVGEDSVVSFVGYVLHPHYSDLGSGETVNCNKPDKEENDIHFSVSPKDVKLPTGKAERQSALCKTITAEIIPHFRPAQWEVPILKKLEEEKLPIKVTGHLFFDASHAPCNDDGTLPKGNPPRESLWEIHPVYGIDICSHTRGQGTLSPETPCQGGTWVPLDKWVAHNQTEIKSSKRKSSSVDEDEDSGNPQ